MRPNKEDHIRYYDHYLNLVPEQNVLEALMNNHREVLSFIKSIPNDKAQHRYAEGKWSVMQVLNHVIDTERIFCYRALRFARGDKQLLPGYDENAYADNANLTHTNLALLAEEFDIVRKATILFAQQLDEKEWLRKGMTASGEANVLSLIYLVCGHTTHHMNVIKERYL